MTDFISRVPPGLLQRLTFTFGEHTVAADHVSDVEFLWQQLISLGEDHPAVKDERIPYWAEIWPASVALSKYVAVHPERVSGSTVLEIGCGTALPGITAALHGAHVTLTDYLQDPLDLAAHNWKLNLAPPPVTSLLDWRHPDPAFSADVILASDVAYEKRAYEPLASAFRILTKPGGIILLSEPGRSMTAGFLDALPQLGFEILAREIIPVEWRGTTFPNRVMVMRPVV